MADWSISLLLLVVGQVSLIALGPLSRVGDPGAGTAGPGGIALLAPDSVGYLADARTWSAVASAPWPRWGYLALLRVGAVLGDAATVAIVVQLLATTAAGVLLLRIGRRLAGPIAGVTAAAVLLVNPMTAQWVRFVLTESLFYALAVTAVALAATRESGPPTDRSLLAVAAAAVVLRPTGPLLAGAAVTLVLMARPWTAWRRGAAVVVLWAVVAVALVAGTAATGPPAEGTFAAQLRGGVVVEGTPEVRTTIPMPSAGGDGALDYVVAEPLAAARLALTRVAVEVAQVRRHYPPVVNLALGAVILALAAMAALGLRDPRGRPLRIPTAVVLLPLVGVVAVTFAVPEGRYGWAGLVALAPAVGVGAAVALERLRPQAGGGTAR